jgi:hypothetical protein
MSMIHKQALFLQALDLTEKSRTENKEDGGGLTNQQLCIIYAICHVTGMLSACANPVRISNRYVTPRLVPR